MQKLKNIEKDLENKEAELKFKTKQYEDQLEYISMLENQNRELQNKVTILKKFKNSCTFKESTTYKPEIHTERSYTTVNLSRVTQSS